MSTGASNHEKIQTVVFVRHGVAKHNLYVDGKPPNLQDPMLFDPPLVFEGKKQALDVGEILRAWWHTTQTGEQIELVVTSPLTRCIQTASLAFLRGDCYTDGRQEPSFFCSELIREAYGMHYPDRRRNKSFLEAQWPHAAFDQKMTEEDKEWNPTERETVNHMARRIGSFLHWLVQCPQSNIIVISHGVWIETCFHICCPEALDHGNRRVYNCNMFSSECVSVNGKFVRLQNVRQIK